MLFVLLPKVGIKKKQSSSKRTLNQSFKNPRAPRYNQNAMKTIFCESATIVAFSAFPLLPSDET